MARQRSWEQIKREAPVDEALVATYRALLEAERALATLLDSGGGGEIEGAPGVDGPTIEDALAAAEAAASAGAPGLGLYLETLRRYLESLGGRLELRAVLPAGEVELPVGPDSRRG